MRGSWRLNKDCNILTSPAPPDIAVCRSCSPGLLNQRPGGPLHWMLFSLLHLVSNSSDLQLTQTSCAELYYCFTPTQSILMASQARICHFWHLRTGMFDHHQAEITVMQFRGHPLPVHLFLTVLWDFNPVPYYQPSSPTQSLVWVGGQYTTVRDLETSEGLVSFCPTTLASCEILLLYNVSRNVVGELIQGAADTYIQTDKFTIA